MKVCEVHAQTKILGGGTRFLYEFSKEPRKRGDTVIALVIRNNGDNDAYDRIYSCDNIITNMLSLWGILPNILAMYNTARVCLTEKPDVFHFHTFSYMSPYIVIIPKIFSIPCVVNIHDYIHCCPKYIPYLLDNDEICKKWRWDMSCLISCIWRPFDIYSMLKRQLYCVFISIADAIIVPTEDLKSRININKDRVEVITHFIEEMHNPKKGRDEYVLFTGRLTRGKGAANLLHSWKIIESRDKRLGLIICGDGDEKNRLQELSKEMGLKRVSFKGFVDKRELGGYYATAKCVVVPSLWAEAFGLVVTEAYAYGTPVSASNTFGLRYNTQDGYTGYNFNPCDIQDMAKNILRTAKESARLSKNIIKFRKRFSKEGAIQSYVDIFNKLTGRRESDILREAAHR